MGKMKQLLHENLAGGISVPSHLDKEMYEELIKVKKQITAIKKILEECK